MSDLRIIHNPRCSKSRQTLQLLQEKGLEPEVIEYLKSPLSEAQIKDIMQMLGITNPKDMMRTKEAEFKELGLNDAGTSDDALIKAMSSTPKLIERPIVINGDKARIGRPPENVLEIV